MVVYFMTELDTIKQNMANEDYEVRKKACEELI